VFLFFVECRGIATLRSTNERLVDKVDTFSVTVASRTLCVNVRDDSCASRTHLYVYTRSLSAFCITKQGRSLHTTQQIESRNK